MFRRGLYDDDDDDNDDDDYYGGPFGFHNPMANLARMVVVQQLLREGRSFRPAEGCKFVMGWSTRRDSGDDRVKVFPDSIPRSRISEKITDLFNVPQDGFADLVLIVNELMPIFTHTLVVSSWSRRFKRIIQIENEKLVKEGGGGTQLLLYLRQSEEIAAVFKEFIRFMYTESVEISIRNAWAFVELGAEYGVLEMSRTSALFILKYVRRCSIGPSLVELMASSVNRGLTRMVVPIVMSRLQQELFQEQPEVVSSFSVDLLCDVLRCSEVVAISEFDIYQRLKPKLGALKQQGKDGDVLRILSLLRFTQMKSSELNEINSSEFADNVRRSFPGKFETALWSRTFFAEQSWKELPINIERSRLYLECPIPCLEQPYHHEYDPISGMVVEQGDCKTLIFQSQELGELTILVNGCEQSTPSADRNQARVRIDSSTCTLPTYLLKTGEHGVTKLADGFLKVPTGSFPRPTVDLDLAGKPGVNLISRIVAKCHIKTLDGTPSERKCVIVTRIVSYFEKGTKRISVVPFHYDIADSCEMKVQFICYACQHDDVNLRK